MDADLSSYMRYSLKANAEYFLPKIDIEHEKNSLNSSIKFIKEIIIHTNFYVK